MNILITGKPGIGKTTLIKELFRNLNRKAGGFYTEEIRKEGQRVGFRIKTSEGKTGILASVDTKSPYRVGKYHVNLEDFERVALPAVKGALANSKTVIIDEIGPMELFSRNFKEIIMEVFDSSTQVVATIKLKGSKFIDSLKSRSDVIIYNLRFDNRKDILNEVCLKINR